MFKRLCFLLSVAFFSTPCLSAELFVPSVFSDHMVLQREQPVPVWGKADPGAVITVEFAGQTKTATAGADGKWRVDLEPLTASAESRVLKVSANLKSEIINLQFSDVLVGEVWLCSGQSNMEMAMTSTENAAAVIAAANHPLLRLYKTPRWTANKPQELIKSQWSTCTPATIKAFSGTAYYFGRKLQQDLNIPVGLLLSSWGGTHIEPWTPPCGFESVDKFASILSRIPNLPETAPEEPRAKQTPTALYNGMIHAHIPFAIRGAIWYQGESNHTDGMLYVDKTRALLNGWRKLWGYDFPFYFVQIAPYHYHNEDPSILPVFWEAQTEIAKTIPKTAMAVITDYATTNNIHPRNKEIPGSRLALIAEKNTYGMNVVCSGPVFKTMEKQNGALKITFDSAEGLTTRDGKDPDWFEIAGKDGGFKPAAAKIDGVSIILSSPEVSEPVAMRFAWHKLAMPNLVNSAGIPASSFRAGEMPKPAATGDVAPAAVAAAPAETALQIPEMKNYRIVYRLDIDANANYAEGIPPYNIDNSADTAPFSKIAYCLELQKAGEAVQYVFASMDAFTDDLKNAGVPVASCGARFMQKVSNLTVRSNVKGVIACTDSDGGNIEFWPGNYVFANKQNLPEASPTQFDFGDAASDKIPGYGCMQVHNWKEKQTVFAINHWGTKSIVELGIGNAPAGHPDWTFSKNGPQYTLRRLTVLVK